jgi:hypothetical protein
MKSLSEENPKLKANIKYFKLKLFEANNYLN